MGFEVSPLWRTRSTVTFASHQWVNPNPNPNPNPNLIDSSRLWESSVNTMSKLDPWLLSLPGPAVWAQPTICFVCFYACSNLVQIFTLTLKWTDLILVVKVQRHSDLTKYVYVFFEHDILKVQCVRFRWKGSIGRIFTWNNPGVV